MDRFDADFFGITAAEANAMDPQHRLLLEVSWEALERAAIPAEGLAGSQTGVFIGIASADYRTRFAPGDIDPWTGLGNLGSVAAGRLAFFLGLNGPALALDTSSSSSLVAVHTACQSLRAGECDLALAGGVNLILAPEPTAYMASLGVLAADGRCKVFDGAADGYVRSEGCGVVLLKPLATALVDGDPILAVIRSSAMNQDGRSAGLTAPSRSAQEKLLRTALREADLEPEAIDYVEAHGTGTPLGDWTELQALGAVHRGRQRPLLVGSVKTNIGHAEAAAGMAGLIKTVLALRHERLPAHLHLSQPTPRIPWSDLPVRVTTTAQPWPRRSSSGEPPRLAGVSSFGINGTNAHVILQEAPPSPREGGGGGMGQRGASFPEGGAARHRRGGVATISP